MTTTYQLSSPNGKLRTIINEQSHLSYTVLHETDTIIVPSEISMTLEE